MMDNRDDSWDNFLRLAEPTSSVIPWPYKDIKAEIPAQQRITKKRHERNTVYNIIITQ